MREALKLLEAEGYVAGDSFKGSVVAPFDIEALCRGFESAHIVWKRSWSKARVERERAAAILPNSRLWGTSLRAPYEAGDNETARAANYRFHHHMFKIASMPQTLHFVQILWARYPFDLINALKGRVSRAADEHDDMLAAIIAGDTSAAMLATRKHIEAGWVELRNSIETESTPAAKGPDKQ